jgi:hypothetical protein
MNWIPAFMVAIVFSMLTRLTIDAQGPEIAPFSGAAFGLARLAAALSINHETLTARQRLYRA